MPVNKNLVVIGASDEETAHLRLLIRKATAQLQHRWRWGSEAGADLVVVDPEAFAGQMARTRAVAGGMRCAVIVDEAMPSADLVLHRPLRVENVIDVLNRAGGALSMAVPIEAGRGHSYFDDGSIDATDTAAHLPDAEPTHPPLTPRSTEPPALGFDEVFKRDEAAEKPRFRVPLSLDGDTRLEVAGDPSARSESRRNETVDALAPQPRGPGPNVALPAVKRAVAAEGGRRPLRAYLDEALLGGPAQIALDGAPALTLDPKHATFHTAATPADLERYLREPLSPAQWRPLTTAELAQVREAHPGQPYRRLVWLDVLVNSDGRLAPQLDPGGTYRVKQRFDLGGDHRGHERIVGAMTEPARLNEIAAKAGVPMGGVFDVVNAYHAIGEIEWQSRASLRQPEKPDEKGGLFSRLKRPFGR